MGASQALAIERLLAEGVVSAKKKDGVLLAGLGARLRRASELAAPLETPGALPTALAPLDRLLLGGLPKGRLVELSGPRSCGRFSLGSRRSRRRRRAARAAALVDLGDHLDPQAAEVAGVDLRPPPLGAAAARPGSARGGGDAARDGLPARRRGPRALRRATRGTARRRVGAPRARGRGAGRGASALDAVARERHRRRGGRLGLPRASGLAGKRPRAAPA